MLQLENVIRMVERLPHQMEPHGVNAREHNSSLSLRLWMPVPPLLPRYLWQVARKHSMHGSRDIVLNCYRKESTMTRFNT